jgi:hypothetical protein
MWIMCEFCVFNLVFQLPGWVPWGEKEKRWPKKTNVEERDVSRRSRWFVTATTAQLCSRLKEEDEKSEKTGGSCVKKKGQKKGRKQGGEKT